MAIIHVNKNNFNEVKNSALPVLLDFYADWCGPCRMIAPALEEIANENPQYVVGKINVDKDPALAAAFNVVSIPLLVVLKDGKIVNQALGAQPKAKILALLEG